MQDLRAINEITRDIHPVVANPYTLLTYVKEKYKWFTVIDLKDAFFCIPIDKDSRKLFTFEWENPQSGRKMQLTWTRLPQGFKNSPTLFDSQLAKEIKEWINQGLIQVPKEQYLLLQYVDDNLIATEWESECIQVTIDVLNQLGIGGYKVKIQIACLTVIYLGCEISQGQRRLGVNRIQAICNIPEPQNLHELRAFLGITGWCRLWVMDYGLIAKPLYEAQKARMLVWGKEQKGGHWLLPSRMMKYQAILTEQDDVTLKTTNLLNPAVFLGTTLEEENLNHNCVEIIEYTYVSRADLKHLPLERELI